MCGEETPINGTMITATGSPSTLDRLRAAVKDWPVWWSELSLQRKVLPGGLMVAYWLLIGALHSLRIDHFLIGSIVLVLYYGGRQMKRPTQFIMPFFWTSLIYDSQRFYSDYIRGPVHVSEPYNFDKRFFGIPTAQGVLTPNEFFQIHTHPLLDFVCGFFYLLFIFIYMGICAYFFFWLSRTGTAIKSAAEIARRAPRTMWAFFWLNVIGYSTYYWYAAAPPWYVAAYGLGPANMNAVASPAGCARFDLLLGTHFFTGMYGRSADVFGAIPSLHIAYPLLTIYYAFQFRSSRLFCILFYLIMCFSALYLNHHYVLDILWGSTYALLVAWGLDWYYDRREVGKQSLPSGPSA